MGVSGLRLLGWEFESLDLKPSLPNSSAQTIYYSALLAPQVNCGRWLRQAER